MYDNETQEYEDKMIESYIDKPSETLWYQMSFKKFNINGVDRMQWNWSWWAFGGGFLYLLYRKQYLASFALFFGSFMLSIIPFMSIVIMILSGGYGSYFVYKGYRKKLFEIESVIDDEATRLETMREVGGTHEWVIWVYAIFMILIFMALGAIMMPLMMQV